MSMKQFFKELEGKRIEGEIVKTFLSSLISSLIILGILYFVFLQKVPNFFTEYGIYSLFIIISYSMIFPAIRQIKTYKQFACMPGMMIGMTIGMISGFLIGFFIGATNGMFWGSVFGMLIGIIFGIYNGNCCGIMGIMEGIMAGFMGGLMGAMSSVMMLNEHIKAASIIVIIVSGAILFGLHYMIYKEMKNEEVKDKEKIISSILISATLSILTTLFMVFGPRSVFLI